VTSYTAATSLARAASSEVYTTTRALLAKEKVDDNVRAKLARQISDHELLWSNLEPLLDFRPFLGVDAEGLDLNQAVVDEDPLVTTIRAHTIAMAVI
jgi:hypothetical protein